MHTEFKLLRQIKAIENIVKSETLHDEHLIMAVQRSQIRSIALGCHHFTSTIKAGWADVMTQMYFTSGGFNRQRRIGQEIMCTMHPAFGWGFFVLLYGHCNTPFINLISNAMYMTQQPETHQIQCLHSARHANL
jgi:hypothetical protein